MQIDLTDTPWTSIALARFDAAALATLLEATSESIVLLDVQGRITFANPAAQAILGHRRGTLLGTTALDLVHPRDLERLTSAFADVVEEGAPDEPLRLRLRTHDGTWRHVEAHVQDLLGTPGIESFLVGLRDVTERRRTETALLRQALHDPLTGLPNRVLFYDRLEHALVRTDRHHESPAVLFVDLDGFKAINDRFGHAAGDAVLTTVGRRLTAAVRPADTVARLGGDEFLVLCEDVTDDEQLGHLRDRIRDAVRQPIDLGGHRAQVGLSIGVARARSGTLDDPDQLVHAADEAMYLDKAAGRDGTRPTSSIIQSARRRRST